MQNIHHDRLIQALKAHWQDAGGPLSLTAFLKTCRPSIAPLLARGVPWRWIGARVLAVHENPDAEISPDLEPLAGGKVRSLVVLYSRSTRRLDRQDTAAFSAARAAPAAAASRKPLDYAIRALPTPESGADPPEDRRARIRQSAAITKKLEQLE